MNFYMEWEHYHLFKCELISNTRNGICIISLPISLQSPNVIVCMLRPHFRESKFVISSFDSPCLLSVKSTHFILYLGSRVTIYKIFSYLDSIKFIYYFPIFDFILKSHELTSLSLLISNRQINSKIPHIFAKNKCDVGFFCIGDNMS